MRSLETRCGSAIQSVGRRVRPCRAAEEGPVHLRQARQGRPDLALHRSAIAPPYSALAFHNAAARSLDGVPAGVPVDSELRPPLPSINESWHCKSPILLAHESSRNRYSAMGPAVRWNAAGFAERRGCTVGLLSSSISPRCDDAEPSDWYRQPGDRFPLFCGLNGQADLEVDRAQR